MIRKAKTEDVEVIARFNYNMAKETEDLELNMEVLLQGVKTAVEDESKAAYFVYEKDGKVVGQLMITKEWSDWRNGEIWWIQSVYVDAGYRKMGIFKQLYKYVENIVLLDNKIAGLRLYVEKHNDVAKATYKSLGMSETNYYIYEMIK